MDARRRHLLGGHNKMRKSMCARPRKFPSNSTQMILVVMVVVAVSFARLAAASSQELDAVKSTAPPNGTGPTNRNDRGPASLADDTQTDAAAAERRTFAVELLKMLHEQYGGRTGEPMQERKSDGPSGRSSTGQLLEALGAEGDMRRLIDWVQSSLNLASIPEVTSQFVVSKLGSVNCPALLQPDGEETLQPRFLLFNEHYVDVPYELQAGPSAADCIAHGKFDPVRKTVILIHGYLGGYTLIDGLTNIKNRLLDLNRLASEQAIRSFIRSSHSNASYVFTEDLDRKIRAQLYNVIIIDWFNGANPTPRSNYIRAAVNAQVVGRLIARFLSALVVQCGTPASRLQIVGHSLGCHVSGFTGKAMRAAGHRLGKITHLDPVGLCFGRLFSQARFRLSPDDALETQAVHVSLNIFDNPLDGAHSNFLVNGGRDQPGCGNQNEVTNSTSSSAALLFDPAARFAPCSHLRAFALLEDDHSSEAGQCQYVGYRCSSYDRFLAGKCGQCDSTNSQCRLMGMEPLAMQFRRMLISSQSPSYYNIEALEYDQHQPSQRDSPAAVAAAAAALKWSDLNPNGSAQVTVRLPAAAGNDSKVDRPTTGSLASTTTSPRSAPSLQLGLLATSPAPASARSSTRMYGEPSYLVADRGLRQRSERRLAGERRELLSQAIKQMRAETRFVWTSLRDTKAQASDETTPAGGRLPADDEESPEGAELEASAGSETADGSATTSTTTTTTTTADAAAAAATTTTNNMAGGPQATTATPEGAQKEHPRAALSQISLRSSPSGGGGGGMVAPAATARAPSNLLEAVDLLAQRRLAELTDQVPLGGQAIPAGSLNGPLFFLGTSSLTPFCVNYYQFRVLIAESRLQRMMSQNGLASNRLKAQYNQHAGGIIRAAAASLPQRAAGSSGREMLHLTLKLTDSLGHFFKGFSVLESARLLGRVVNEFVAGPPLPLGQRTPSVGLNEPMVEITMLLNSTRPQPTKVSETIISYYFHPIVLADRVEVNYMSNISPEIRAKYSSVLCPVAINDRHQLVRYIECHKVSRR